MKNFELMIARGGLTAARAITSYRESGGGGQILEHAPMNALELEVAGGRSR